MATMLVAEDEAELREHLRSELHDRGYHIPSEQLPRLFDPNLAIARDILRSHGGELSVQPGDEGGASFTMVLPPASAPRSRPRTDSPVAISGPRLRILLIDDEPNILKSYKRAIGAGHDLVLASHGQEALDAIRSVAAFDLVVCDVSMPTMSGMQLFERVRKSVPALATRFVFATGGATQKSVEKFLASIPNLVLEKPFEMRVLRELVADWCARPRSAASRAAEETGVVATTEPGGNGRGEHATGESRER